MVQHLVARIRLRRVLLVGLTGLLGGCGAPWRPVLPAVESKPAVERFNIEPYLRAWRVGYWSYQREQLTPHEGIRPQAYSRICDRTRMIEGKLIGRHFLPLDRYLHPPAAAAPARSEQGRSIPPLQGGTALMFELADSMEPIPPELTPGEPITSSTALIYYDYDGRPLAEGTLTREVEIESVEDIDCPAGHYPACLRVRLDLTVHLSWILDLNWTSYLWLSSKAGEVRRLQHMSGRFLIFWFSSTYQYELASGGPFSLPASQDLPPPRWKYGAVLLDTAVPRPQIAGMIVDYADRSTTAPAPAWEPATSSPATQPITR